MVETISQLLLVALAIANTDMPPQVCLKGDGNYVASRQKINSFCLNHHPPTPFFRSSFCAITTELMRCSYDLGSYAFLAELDG